VAKGASLLPAPLKVLIEGIKQKQDEKMKLLGKMMMVNVLEGFEGFMLAFFTRQLGMSGDQVKAFNDQVLEELRNQRLNLWVKMVVSYGQKPLHPEDQDSAYHSGHGSMNRRSSVESMEPILG
jgi:hypothetical protein